MKRCLFGVGAFVLALGMAVGLKVQAEIDPDTRVPNTVQVNLTKMLTQGPIEQRQTRPSSV